MNLIANVVSEENQIQPREEQLFLIKNFNFITDVGDESAEVWEENTAQLQFGRLICVDKCMMQQIIKILINTPRFFSSNPYHWFYTEEGWRCIYLNDSGVMKITTHLNPDLNQAFSLWLPMPTLAH